MKSTRSIDSRIGYIIASLGLMFAMIGSAFFPTFAGATGLLETRSIAMTTSASAATGVSYNLKFTPENPVTATTGGAVIEFCDNNPLIGLACDSTDGSNVNVGSATLGAVVYNATTESGGAAGSIATSIDGDATGSPANKNVITWTAGTSYNTTSNVPISITFNNLTNPTVSGSNSTVFARVTTYGTNLASWTGGTGAHVGTPADEGGVALGYNTATAITAYVQESLTFCVSKSSSAPTDGCGGTADPSLTLGEAVGTGTALSATAVSHAADDAQLSTNASSGAVVNLENNVTCGGLSRSVAPTTCNIAAQNTSPLSSGDITAGNALFGLEVAADTDPSGGLSSGTLTATSPYAASHYFIDYNSGSPTTAGVTSPYGSALFNSGGAPVSNKNELITFGASIANTTPAGIYQATLRMIATGTF